MTQKIERLMSLAQKCYESFAVAQNDSTLRPYLIKGTLPILYFGDIEAYFKSQYKIITAAINPSFGEFFYDKSSKQISFKRFPQFESIANANALNNENALQYLSALNGYFKTGNDYKKWFKTTPRDNLLLHLVRHIMKMRQIGRFTRIFYRHLLHFLLGVKCLCIFKRNLAMLGFACGVS